MFGEYYTLAGFGVGGEARFVPNRKGLGVFNGFYINDKVADRISDAVLDAMLAHLRTLDVSIDDRIIVWERGKHAWIHDPDGNRIELYEELLAGTNA